MIKLFDSLSYLDINPEDCAEDYLCHTGKQETDFPNREALLGEIVNFYSDYTEIEWEDFLENCGDEENHHCLVTGYFMSWRGPLEGGMIYKNLATAVQEIIMEDSHVIFSIDDKGVLVLDETHHDAPYSGNHYEFLILTDAGEKFLEKHRDMERRELCEALKLRGRSRNVNTKIFGF